MKRFVALLLCILLTTSCCTCRRYRDITLEHTIETIDSVIYRPEQVSVPIPREIASSTVSTNDTARAQTSVAEAVAWVEDGQLHQQLRNRSDQLLRITLDVPVYIHSEKEVLVRTAVQEVAKPLGWFKKTLMYAGAVALVAAIAAIITAIIRH